MISRRDGAEHDHVPGMFRVWRITTIYIAVATTVVVALLLWELLHGPLPHTPTTCPR